MKKSEWEARLKAVEENNKNSKDTIKLAKTHIEEGELIIEAIKEKIKNMPDDKKDEDKETAIAKACR